MGKKPTEKQFAYIRSLAIQTNTSLYLGKLKTMEEASRMIDSLKQKLREMGAANRREPEKQMRGA